MLTEQELTALEARHAASTPGAWYVGRNAAAPVLIYTPRTPDGEAAPNGWIVADCAPLGEDGDDAERADLPCHDAAFIAAAHQDVPALITALRAAWAEREALRAAGQRLGCSPQPSGAVEAMPL